MIPSRFHRFVLPAALVVASVAGCGDDPPGEQQFLPPSSALALSAPIRAVRAEPHRTFANNLDIFERDLAAAENVIVQLQIHSEYGQRTNATDELSFVEQIAGIRARSAGRAGALMDEAERSWWVLDLQRLDREWLVDWGGLERDDADNRRASFTVGVRTLDFRDDYGAAVRKAVADALEEIPTEPHAIVLGAELDRYWVQNREDWPYMVDLLGSVAGQIRASHPDVRIGVGMNWSSFMDEAVPALLEEAGRTRVDYLAVLYAWQQIVEPVYFDDAGAARFDFYAFASIPDSERYASGPSAVPDTHYAFLPTLFATQPDRRLPVAWYAVGWPSDSHAQQTDGEFLERFLELNGGYDVALVSWWGFADLLAQSECPANLIADVPAPRSFCYRGMYPELPQFTTETAVSRRFFGSR